jgi:hypothetical protein
LSGPSVIRKIILISRILRGKGLTSVRAGKVFIILRCFFISLYICFYLFIYFMRYRSCLSHYATVRKVTGSIPDEVIKFFS